VIDPSTIGAELSGVLVGTTCEATDLRVAVGRFPAERAAAPEVDVAGVCDAGAEEAEEVAAGASWAQALLDPVGASSESEGWGNVNDFWQ
jgi:hypothetical protein